MTPSRLLAPFRRALAMDQGERRFRAACELRRRSDQMAFALRTPSWDRRVFTRLLAPTAVDASDDLRRSRDLARAGDWPGAHLALASHFAQRTAPFPLQPAAVHALVARIRERFPDAAGESGRRAGKILEGRYDLLGYRDLQFGAPPDWHADPVSGRRAAAGFWASVPYLDPSGGDHKVIWELNRHQHFLALARAWWLNGDARSYREFVAQLESWLSANPPLSGVNWASMLELGFRSLSWLWALHLFAAAAESSDAFPWTIDLLTGIERQLTQVEHNLSRYFSPNTHLSGEALALFVAGSSLPELASAARWRALGRSVLLEEATRQVHADGGHAELSAHYHRYSTDFYLLALLVARAAGDPAAERFEHAVLRQAEFLRTIADDSGRLPLLGDDDGGQLFPMCGREPSDCRDTLSAAAVALERPDLGLGAIPEEVYWLCGTSANLPDDHAPLQAWPSRPFFESGYFVSRSGRGDHLLFDAGRHGFLNGGHAHADALSVVLSIGGHPLLVDPGTATYTMEPHLRDLFRSSAMHNTIIVNGRPPAEPRGPFHWSRTATARPTVWRSERQFDYVEGIHDGYAPMAHARAVLAVHGLGWFIVDRILGDGAATAEAFWHLHPGWHVVPAGPFAVTARQGRDATALSCSTPLEILAARDGPGLDAFAPVYGRVERGTCVIARAHGRLPLVLATFVPACMAADAQVAIEGLDVSRPPADQWQGSAFRIRIGAEEYVLLTAVERRALEVPVPGSEAARNRATPGDLWGCAAVVTDARLVLLRTPRENERSCERMAIVNGSLVECPAAHVASSVHQSRVAGAS